MSPIDRIGPMHPNIPIAVFAAASRPVFIAHEHSVRRANLFSVGDDMDLMAPFGQRMGVLVVVHRDPPFDRGKFADDANSHRWISTRFMPASVRTRPGSSSSLCSSDAASGRQSIEPRSRS